MEAIPTHSLPSIPAKRYFTIGEVSDLCGVKPHVLRYWEQEFTQLKPLKRRGNRRYYQHHEVLLIRRIRELLYEHGFTINGARNRLDEPVAAKAHSPVKASGLTPAQIRQELKSVLVLLQRRPLAGTRKDSTKRSPCRRCAAISTANRTVMTKGTPANRTTDFAAGARIWTARIVSR